jgi:hypothetical protein
MFALNNSPHVCELDQLGPCPLDASSPGAAPPGACRLAVCRTWPSFYGRNWVARGIGRMARSGRV